MSSKYVPFMTSGSLHSKKSNTSSTVKLLHEIDIAEVLKRDNVNQDLWTKSQTSSTSSSYRNLCLLDVPAHMIPKEILRFFGSSLSLISSIRIVKHSSESDRYLALLDVASPAATHTLISEFSGQMLSSLENVRCLLLLVANVSFDSEDESCSKEIDTLAIGGGDSVGHCPVCLESFEDSLPNCITTFCKHRFHMQCMLQLESSQCPVCRFQHGSDEVSDTECFVCGLRREEGRPDMIGFPREESNHRLDPDLWLCLICGFTGCGTRHGGHIQRHYEESLHTYAQNTETRQVWDFAGDGYVHRLVLNAPSEGDLVVAADADAAHSGKVVELADPHSLLNSRDPRAPMSPEQEQQVVVSAKLEAVARHYNQVLAWQLEQNRLLYETRLQRIRDSARSSSNNTNHQRHQVSASPLSAVGSKCVAPTGKAKGGSKTDKSGSCSVSSRKYCGPTWRENMIASLRNERAKLLKQAEGAKERLARAHREVEVLRELNGSLAHNQGEWQKRVDTAAKVLANAEATYQSEIPLLEEKVRLLMEKLDMIPKSSTGSKQSTDVPATPGATDDKDEQDIPK